MEQQMDELSGGGVQPPAIRSVARGTYPPIDMGENADGVDVYLFAIGLDPKSVNLSIQQNLLTVSGERKVRPTTMPCTTARSVSAVTFSV
jgi:HSP20 family protein